MSLSIRTTHTRVHMRACVCRCARTQMGGRDVEWWDELLRACAADGPTSECPPNTVVMTEVELDARKVHANHLHLHLNARAYPLVPSTSGLRRGGSADDHQEPRAVLPVWIRVCQRTDPLRLVLQQLKLVTGIEHALLLVTVDRDVMEPVLAELANVDYMHVRVYLHPFTASRAALGFSPWDTGVHRLNSHFLFGLRLALLSLPFTYVATLEDDLIPSPDFLDFHRDLAPVAEADRDVAAILAYPNGPMHDCHFIADKLHPFTGNATAQERRGVCGVEAAGTMYSEDFFAGWGAGISRHTFYRFLPAWNFSGIYDGILNGLLSDGVHTLAPCRPRVRIALNTGLHGVSHARWDHWLYPSSTASALMNAPARTTAVYRVLSASPAVLSPAGGAHVAGGGGEVDGDDDAFTCVVTRSLMLRLRREVGEVCAVGERVRDVSGGDLGNASALAQELRQLRQGRERKPGGVRREDELKFRIWSSDFHVGPIGDLKAVWGDLRVHGRAVEVIDRSLSGSCAAAGTCATGSDLRVLNQSNGQDLGPDPESLMEAFQREHADDAVVRSADAFVCSHPAGMCEVFEGFNRSLLVYASTRYDMAR